VRRHALQDRRRGRLVRQSGRRRDGLRDRDDRLLGVAALSVPPADAVAGGEARHALADGGDRPGALDAGDERQHQPGDHPGPLVDVAVIDAGGADVD